MKNKVNELRAYMYDRADNYCNQKYGDNLPYSFHLRCVESQGEKFIHLIKDEYIINPNNSFSTGASLRDIVRAGLISHEAIEDFRLTYNDIKEVCDLGNTVANTMLADIVYCVTDEKGKSRGERKNDKYYSELKENKLAVFVKLADLAANTLYSKLTGSSMYDKYKEEFPKFKQLVYIEEYAEFFNYVENL